MNLAHNVWGHIFGVIIMTCLFWWFLGQVQNWVTWSQTVGHHANSKKNLVNTRDNVFEVIIMYLNQSVCLSWWFLGQVGTWLTYDLYFTVQWGIPFWGSGSRVGLALCYFVVCSARRFVFCFMSYLVSFCSCVFSPFSIAITSLGEERANLSAFRTFVRFVLVWICRFPLPLVFWEGLQFVIVALPGLFSYLFC